MTATLATPTARFLTLAAAVDYLLASGGHGVVMRNVVRDRATGHVYAADWYAVGWDSVEEAHGYGMKIVDDLSDLGIDAPYHGDADAE